MRPKTISFQAPASPEECRQRLSEAIDLKTRWGVKSHSHQVVGSVDDRQFRLQKTHFKGSGLAPILVGRFHPENQGTKIEANFRPALGGEIVLLLIMEFIGFVIARNGIAIPSIAYGVMFGVWLLLISVIRSTAAPEEEFLEGFLRDKLASDLKKAKRAASDEEPL